MTRSSLPGYRENFIVVRAAREGKPLVGNFNRWFRYFTEKARYAWCVHLVVGLDIYHKDGLPDNDEASDVNRFKDKLLIETEPAGPLLYVGHHFWNASSDIYAYTDAPEALHARLQSITRQKKIDKEFTYTISRDPDWSKVAPFLG
jgi:hypothetical protein